MQPGRQEEVEDHKEQSTLFKKIRDLVLASRSAVARGADLAQVHTCFQVGRHIVDNEQAGKRRAGYGKEVLKTLAERLTKELGRGFSKANLENMRRFYLAYRERATGIAQFRIGQSSGSPFPLGWTQYLLLMGIADPNERQFYEIEAASQGWNCQELRRQVDSSLYERLALSRDKEGVRRLAQEGQIIGKAQDILKEPLVLEFLGLEEKSNFSETDLESAIINRIEHFLLELGKGFLFEARQKRFTFDDEHFFVDLVFYNRLLRCYVLIDLKIGKLTHQDLGQMQMYVNYFDRKVRQEDENPTIGIILCKKRHEALVEITLPKGANIHARAYQLYLPSKEDLRRHLEEWSSPDSNSG